MTLIHFVPRVRARWSLKAMIGALLIALAALTGCAELPRGPLTAPSQAMYLTEGQPRALGPLKRVPESDVTIHEKDLPTGTITLAKSTLDMDSMVRAEVGAQSVDMRVTLYHGSAVRVKNLGETKQGRLWYRFDYLADEDVSRVDEEKRSERSPVAGKSYLVELGPHGTSVNTWEGGVPSSAELSVVMGDSKYLLGLVNKGGRMSPTVTSDFVTRAVRNSLVGEGMEVGDVNASFKGVREMGSTPCAVFDVSVSAVMKKDEGDTSMVIEMKLSGEYAFRLNDGWEAELFLNGTTMSTGTVLKDGVSVQVSTAGLARFHLTATYREPAQPSSSALASVSEI